jgi:1-aminocyclopropane-1-carboxylate deaminase/D-cysteine desulfhydrase-like pyridoxal-dependent ACC family enzyme
MLKSIPRLSLGFFPTPLHEIPQLEKYLNISKFYVKRDDETDTKTIFEVCCMSKLVFA